MTGSLNNGRRNSPAQLPARHEFAGQAGSEQRTEPTMKNSSVTSIRVLPPPAANSVPEAQPPPSCMPTPNKKAPKATEMPGGATKPLTVWSKKRTVC